MKAKYNCQLHGAHLNCRVRHPGHHRGPHLLRIGWSFYFRTVGLHRVYSGGGGVDFP